MALAEMMVEVDEEVLPKNAEEIAAAFVDPLEAARKLVAEADEADKQARQKGAIEGINRVLEQFKCVMLPGFAWPADGEPQRSIQVIAK